ncbi:uncharacterized protein E5676_scaffold1610G00210 [Cucumis melo var. makuwa]|uniref:Uncharacterized protein n=1 Tax=Cucumis melo var. makuwa TaxID=1194695 RepID=A0A5D3CSH8_CUCMM|nr:uncharacterized protein E5676_scaffold1610G00210 [Cucumis melo var. makuwa]
MKTRDLGLGYETIHAWSADMKWHRDKCVETDDVLRHPADAEGWKHFDSEYPDFAFDPRNYVACCVTPYNLPPWKCMKETNFFMSLLISDPRSSGRKIDMYLQPLIEELKVWTFGVRTYNSLTYQFFQLFAALLWTINDFPAHGDLLGWSTKRYQTSPICMGDRSSFGIRGRISFMGHRQYLPDNHVWRRSRLHDGKVERRAPPVVMNGHEILEQLEDEIIVDFEIFKQKVRTLCASFVRAISQEEKRLFHWYILNNVDEISEYRK